MSAQDTTVIVHFESEETVPSPQERVTVRINTVLKNSVLLVPKRFIQEEEGVPYVYVREDGEKRRTAVLVGIEWHDMQELAEGVEEGDVLVHP